ncbi:MAG: glutamine-hydrolyzing carbamoyl-phosphate synthase small subunit [Bacteroidales bacterium]|nr:glutamine-hydrolyzing carbamoyl-phosphate synthase small subunit [Bacteroidales bacterium]
MQSNKKVKLILENGLEFEGYSFGYDQPANGEVVFSTAMVGYPETLTDPSYSGQILVSTYPILGNYGVPSDEKENGIEKFFESGKIHVKALVITDYSFNYSHWNAAKSLDEWLKEEKIPGIYGVDTRELTKTLRENGSMLGRIVPEGASADFPVEDPNKENCVAKVSCSEVIRYGNGDKKVVLIDCGTRNSIIRWLLGNGVEVIRVPWNYNFNELEYDGLCISNGPGDPNFCTETVKNIEIAMGKGKPVCGVCMGNQLLALAAGAKVFKLKYGHRGHNQPVRMSNTTSCFITSQNHGYAVDVESLPQDWEPLFVNMNDNTCEGIRHKSKPFFSAQFNPQAAAVSPVTNQIFDEFFKML